MKAMSPGKTPSLSTDTIFRKSRGASSAVVDLADFYYVECDPANELVKSRAKYITAFVESIRVRERAGSSNSTLYEKVNSLQNYLIFCDRSGIDAFSVEGMAGFHAALSKEFRAYESRKRFLFQHAHGDRLGLKSTSCCHLFSSMTTALEMCGYPATLQANDFPMFRQGDKEPFSALSRSERDKFLKRCHEYFFELALVLSSKSVSIPPEETTVVVDGCEWKVRRTLSPGKGDTQVSFGEPLNQFMAAAYHLLSFYTAFNDSQLCDIGRDFEIDQSASKSNPKYYDLVVNKPRSQGKAVEAKVGGSIEKSGRRVLEKVIDISKKYDEQGIGTLLYMKRVDGRNVRFRQSAYLDKSIPCVLSLQSDHSHLVADHLVNVFVEIVKNGRRPSIGKTKSKDGLGSLVRKVLIKVKMPQKFAPDIAYAAMSAITGLDRELKGILRGLDYEPLNDGQLRVSYHRADETSGSFVCDEKYGDFFRLLEDYGRTKIPEGTERFPKYLIPFGSMDRSVHQWDGFSPDNQHTFLRKIGIRSGEYLISLNSSVLRETCATAVRDSGSKEDVVALILNDSLVTALKHYSKGNPDDTKKVLHEGILVVQELSGGGSLSEAKARVAKLHNVEVLKFDEIDRHDGAVNAAGVFCSANGGDGERPKSHSVSSRRVKDLDIEIENIPCFQYQNCPGCASAKLVDDSDLVYQLLSLAEALAQGADLYPENESEILRVSQEYKSLVANNISPKVAQRALERLINEGLHPLFSDVQVSTDLMV